MIFHHKFRVLFFSLLVPFLLPLSLNAGVRFVDVTLSAGLTDAIGGEGVCVFDYDNDGLPDIFIAGFGGRSLLYRNLGNLQFEETSAAAGVDSVGRARTPTAADFDNDGYTDLLVACYQDSTRLFRNLGNGTFEDVTAFSGIGNNANAHGSVWFDYERDGKLDLYVGNFSAANILCRNNGDNTFTEIAASVGAEGPMPSGLVMGVALLDYDLDGDEDIFMAQDGNRGNVLLRRENDGSYTDVSGAAGVDVEVQGMGVAVGDYNRDRFFDVYTTNLDESTLFRNNGDGTFSDVTLQAGVGDQPAHMGWGTFFFDADNDGWLDLYNNNQTGFGGIPNSFFRNNGDGTFEDLSISSGLQSYNDGIGSACADFDNDGDLDIFLSGHPSGAGNLKLFRNDSDDPHNWIQFTLQQDGENRDAIGAMLEVWTATGTQVSMVSAGGGYLSQNPLRQHFGLGLESMVDSVVVHWPDGLREMFIAPSVNTHHILIKGAGTTDVAVEGVEPADFDLSQNFPNPFNPATSITFDIPAGRSRAVSLRVFDVLGREIVTLVDQNLPPGRYTETWDAAAYAGGTYFYRLTAGGFSKVRKMILLK